MKISNKRKLELTEKFQEEYAVGVTRGADGSLYDFGLHEDMADLTGIADYWLNIIDQELSNHTHRVIEEISQLPDGVDIHGVDYSDLVYRDAVLSIPSLQTNPTKDNEEVHI